MYGQKKIQVQEPNWFNIKYNLSMYDEKKISISTKNHCVSFTMSPKNLV